MSDAAQLASQRWDAVIVGTGMGGATVGYALAQAGWRVLFCEKGRSTLDAADAVRGDYAECHFPRAEVAAPRHADILRRAGREWDTVDDVSSAQPQRFVPFIGCGTGGSTTLYGMVLERFFAEDFAPRQFHPQEPGSTLPERWPIGYADLEPWYAAAERLYGVRGARDPLRADAPAAAAQAPPLSPAAQEIAQGLAQRGLHPYRLPLACDFVAGCPGCQGYLCARGCKHDSAAACLRPAIERHGAHLLDGCEVLRLEADPTRVTGVVCRRGEGELHLRARVVILAAGALATPALLLRSASAHWPQGLANGSGLVGRNLMRHFVDLYAVFPTHREGLTGNTKELGCSDFYVTPSGKFGTLQSFGRLPPAPLLAAGLEHDVRRGYGRMAAIAFHALARPWLEPALARVFPRAHVLATVMEDLPYADNAVMLPPGDAGVGVAIRYRIRAGARARIEELRRRVRAVLPSRRFLLIKQAESNERLAHACGTCRFGTDPASSVLDGNNQAHGLANLYVTDASFFPSSGGTNPALTIAANALRVGAHLVAGREQT